MRRQECQAWQLTQIAEMFLREALAAGRMRALKVDNVGRRVRHTAFRFIPILLIMLVSRGASGQSSILAVDSAPPVRRKQPSAAGGEMARRYKPEQYSSGPQKKPLSDLTLGNFFSAGWDDDFAMRSRATGTPDLPLLRVQTNYLQRLFRGNFYEQTDLTSATKKNLTDFDGFIDWGFNRRVMLEFDEAYQWIDPRTGSPTASGGGTRACLARIQLVDTESSSLCFNFKVSRPQRYRWERLKRR